MRLYEKAQLALRCRELILAAEADGLTIDDGNVVDLIADNTPVSLMDIRIALNSAGYAERFPRATNLSAFGGSHATN